jgi:plastocyanin
MRGTALITLMTLAIVAAPAQAADRGVTVSNFSFGPAELTIDQGDTVTWTFAGPDTNHSTTTKPDQAESWDSDPRNPTPVHAVGDKFSWNFPNAGEFSYFCKVHASMTAKIVVRPRQAGTPTTPDTVAPRFGTPRVSVKRRRVTFKLDEAGSVTARFRGRTRRTLTRDAHVGTNVLALPKLRPGRYAVTLRATDAAGNESTPATVKFAVPSP